MEAECATATRARQILAVAATIGPDPMSDHSAVPRLRVTTLVALGARVTATRIAGGASAAVTFDAAGDYQITCLIHGSMNMVVHVE